MPFADLLRFANAIIESIQPNELSDDDITKLQSLFPETLILGALDLIDRGNIIKYVTSWGHTEYEVLGSTSTYSVFLDLALASIPYYCSCPAFAYAVLLSETHIMCKHVLAVRLAAKLGVCIERPSGPDELAALFKRQFSLSQASASDTDFRIPGLAVAHSESTWRKLELEHL